MQWASCDKTNGFYIAMGFHEFECVPELWDEKNSCQIYEGSSTACSMIQEIQYRKNQIRKVEVLSRVPQQLS